MVLEQVAGFDGGFVAAADQDDAAALELNEGHGRHGLGRRRQQRRHLWPGLGSLAGPSGRLSNIGKLDRSGAASFRCRFGKNGCFLRTSDRQGRVLCRDGQEPVALGVAELGRGRRIAAATAADRVGIEGDGAVARADQEMPVGISHRSHKFLQTRLRLPVADRLAGTPWKVYIDAYWIAMPEVGSEAAADDPARCFGFVHF